VKEEIEKAYLDGYFAGMNERHTNHTPYTEGFKAGQRNEREYILSFVEDHEGFPLTVEDITHELELRYKFEMNDYLNALMKEQRK
jgi:ribosome modulation factor